VAIALTVADDLQPLVRIGALICEAVRVVDRDPVLDAPIAGAEAAIRARGEVDVSAGRALYRAIGLDPTKTRPASEALLRRVRRGEPLPRINTIVDLGNWCSMEVQLPFGLYDLDRLVPPVEVRRGRAGEEYAGIRKDVVHLAQRLVLADRSGPFGNPTSDSARTMVTADARRVLVVVFAPASTPASTVSRVLDLTSERVSRHAGGREAWRWVS
jgi:DNA/RNA-binding domain of Phe-tRNA-synthetase-like protein